MIFAKLEEMAGDGDSSGYLGNTFDIWYIGMSGILYLCQSTGPTIAGDWSQQTFQRPNAIAATASR